MTIEVIIKAFAFTLAIYVVVIGIILFAGNVEVISPVLLMIIIFFLILGMFEREAERQGMTP